MDEGVLNDLLECSVCLERLDTSSRVLPCQHTFCIKCLKEILNSHKELRCPECRVLVDVKVEDLPPNVLLMRILEGMRNSGGPRKVIVPQMNNRKVLTQQPPQHQLLSNITPTSGGFTYSSGLGDGGKQTHVMPASTPHARAVYDYLSNEPGDLSFKKGDIVILRRRIDPHWFYGETGGKQGAFPITYAQVIVPLPPAIPQCKALFDFKMAAPDEEGCLAFDKGAIINVIRRVDENWAEGRLDDRIGIFPIAFVEMNVLARSLMKLSTNSIPGSSREAPPTPTSDVSSRTIMGLSHQSQVIQRNALSQNHTNYHMQQMSVSSPAPPAAPLTFQQVQQLMVQSHPNYLHPHAQEQPYIDLATLHERRNLVQNTGIAKPSHLGQEALVPAISNMSNQQNRSNVKQLGTLTSSYHTTNNITSDSSSTTTTPSFGGSSATTTPNTSSNTSSASESNTPSSPASPIYNAQAKVSALQTVKENPSPIPQVSQTPQRSTSMHGNMLREDNMADSSPAVNSSSPSILDRNNLQISSNNSPTQHPTPPRSNMSSPQTCNENNTNVPFSSSGYSVISNTYTSANPFINVQHKYSAEMMPECQSYSTFYSLNEPVSCGGDVLAMRQQRETSIIGVTRTSHSHHHRDKEKRHSLTPGGQILVPQHTVYNRHSAEILSPPPATMNTEVTLDRIQLKEATDHDRHRKDKSHRERERAFTVSAGDREKKEKEKHGKRRSGSADRHLPASYVALYPYKPQKSDELELKKGATYTVLERCQDGWFKGCANRTQKCGVFPGNYVMLVPKNMQGSPASSSPRSKHSTSDSKASSSGMSKSSSRNKNTDLIQSAIQPPDLPPRSASPGASNSSPVFPWSSTSKTSKSSEKSRDKHKNEKTPSSGVSLMKRLAAMKMSKSPPPSGHGFSMDNPVFEDCVPLPSSSQQSAQQSAHNTVHVRSGSCPSQLLQNPVTLSDNLNQQMQQFNVQLTAGGSVSSAVAHRLFPGHNSGAVKGSQTLGPSQSHGNQRRQVRPSVLNALVGTPDNLATLGTPNKQVFVNRQGTDGPWLPVSTRQPHHHRKSHSLDAGQQLRPNKESVTVTKERFRCIVAYPPNSEYELELKVDDVVVVHKKWGDGWYKGTLERTGRTGLFPASFVEAC